MGWHSDSTSLSNDISVSQLANGYNSTWSLQKITSGDYAKWYGNSTSFFANIFAS